jgi:hypothetical protein
LRYWQRFSCMNFGGHRHSDHSIPSLIPKVPVILTYKLYAFQINSPKSFFYLAIYPLSFSLIYLSVYQSIYLSICLSILASVLYSKLIALSKYHLNQIWMRLKAWFILRQIALQYALVNVFQNTMTWVSLTSHTSSS